MSNTIKIKARVRHIRTYYHEGYNEVEVEVPVGSSLEAVEHALLEEADRTSGDVSMSIMCSPDEPDELEIDRWNEDPTKTIQSQINAAGP